MAYLWGVGALWTQGGSISAPTTKRAARMFHRMISLWVGNALQGPMRALWEVHMPSPRRIAYLGMSSE